MFSSRGEDAGVGVEGCRTKQCHLYEGQESRSIYPINKYLLNSYYVLSKKEENEQESKMTKNTGGVK